jgi:hypothetical protein
MVTAHFSTRALRSRMDDGLWTAGFWVANPVLREVDVSRSKGLQVHTDVADFRILHYNAEGPQGNAH